MGIVTLTRTIIKNEDSTESLQFHISYDPTVITGR